MNAVEKAAQAKQLAKQEKLADYCDEALKYFNQYKNACKKAVPEKEEEKCIRYWRAKTWIEPCDRRDLKKAVKLFTKSAKGGYADAMYNLGYIYNKVYTKPKKTYFWYKAGAEAGNVDCMHMVALCYSQGHGVMSSNSKANYWFEQEKQANKK